MLKEYRGVRPLKRTILREEFLILTGSPLRALVLNQFLYWTGRFFEFDRIILEEKIAATQSGNQSPHDFLCFQNKAWFFKRMVDLKDEIMLDVSDDDLWSSVVYLIQNDWVESQKIDENDQKDTFRFCCHIQKIQQDLGQLGYVLPHFSLLGSPADPTHLSAKPADERDGKPSLHRNPSYLPDESDLNLPNSSGFFLKEDGTEIGYNFN